MEEIKIIEPEKLLDLINRMVKTDVGSGSQICNCQCGYNGGYNIE